MSKHFLFSCIIAFNIVSSFAATIDKAFERLKVLNYFEAKALFEKSLKKQRSAASFGLATIYYRTDNPYHNLDSAYKYVLIAEQTYGTQSEKNKEKFKNYGFDYLITVELRRKISTEFYKIAVKNNDEEGFQNFLDLHPWAIERHDAIKKRDSIAYLEARKVNSSVAFENFLLKYPDSEYSKFVWEDFYLKQYQEKTKKGTVSEFLSFIENHPKNPYKKDAEDRVFEIQTSPNTIESYKTFITSFPQNRNSETAWRKLYQLYMFDYSTTRIEQFKKEFPNYPFKGELDNEMMLVKQNLIPYKDGTLFGFMDYFGNIIYKAQYESLSFFKEGLSLAAKNGKYGYVDKSNKVVIPFIFDAGSDFEEGRAIVEKNNKMGIIDRTGMLLFEIEFEDIGQFSDGLIYGKRDSLYAYYDKFGHQRIPERFDEAFSFSGGYAKVQVKNKQAYIDTYGNFIVPPVYEEISFFTDTLFVFSNDDLYGIMDKAGEIILQAEFEQIGQLSSNRAICVKDDLIGYLNEKGELIIPPTFETFPNYLSISQFKENHAKVKLKDKFGIIDLSGKFVVPAVNSSLGDVSKWVAFSKGKLWGYVDLNNKIIVSPMYEAAESFQGDFALAELMAQKGIINKEGSWVIRPEYSEIKKIGKDMFLVSKGANYGILSSEGLTLVDLNYQQIRQLQSNLIVLINSENLDYYLIDEAKSEARLIKVRKMNE
jgi:hypothetical protein